MGRALTHCPTCGSAVTPYAAGCAICGADLEAARARAQRRWPWSARRGLPRVDADTRNTVLMILIVALVVVFASLIGVLLALFVAFDRNRQGDIGNRNILLLLALAGAVFLLVPTADPVNVL
jgi:hypothetical protein